MIAIALVLLSASETSHDAARRAWQFRREVQLVPTAAPGPEYGRLSVPAEVLTHSQRSEADLRLLDRDGREVPYLMARREDRSEVSRDYGRLSEVERVKKVHSRWLVDFDEARTFDTVILQNSMRDQAKTVTLEMADRAGGPFRAMARGTLFDQVWAGARLHADEITLASPVTARFVRVSVDDRDKMPITIEGALVTRRLEVKAQRWSHPVSITASTLAGGVGRYTLAWPRSLFADEIVIATTTPRFHRRVRLVEERESMRQVLGDEVVYRFAAGEGGVPAERLRVPVQLPEDRDGGTVFLEIEHGDSPELTGLAVSASGPRVELYYAAEAAPAFLYYGNPQSRAPLYDLLRYSDAVMSRPTFVETQLSNEVKNPLYARPQPLAFVATHGAELTEAQRWQRSRPVFPAAGADLYGFLLEPEDLAWLRPDMGDLRLIDARGRQVPYIIDTSRHPRVTPLPFSREPSEGTVSLYRLTAGASPTHALPIDGLEITVPQNYFSRPVKLSAPTITRGQETLRAVFAGRLERTSGDSGPLRLRFPEVRSHTLVLAIDEGDNEPLVIDSVRARVEVPRIAFKWGDAPQDLRLVAGNPDAERPAYDLEMLRAEVLAYDTVQASLGEATSNPHFRRPLSDYVSGASSTVVLWVTLAALVIGLLVLTARLLKNEKAAGK